MKLHVFLAGLLLFLSCSASDKVPSQAEAVQRLFKAVKQGDRELLATVWVKTYSERFEKNGWDKTLAEYEEGLRMNGWDKWDFEKITYKFQAASETTGTVEIIYGEESHGKLKVAKENGQWLVSEK